MATKVFLATDHAGFATKESVKEYLLSNGYEVVDCGASNLDEYDDYPDFISLAAKEISKSPLDRAVIFGGSGQGEAMMANRYKNVRATVYYGGPESIITLSREHNNANVLSLGSRFLSDEEAVSAVDKWLSIDFSGEERHTRRIAKIDNLS